MSRASEPVAWLSHVDVSGPFLVSAVLEQAFPQGLEKIETPRRQRLRAAYDEWQDAVDEVDPQLAELHDAWVRMVLEDCLEYDNESISPKAELAGSIVYRPLEHETEYLPDFAVRVGDGSPRLLISVYPPGTNLENPLPQETWLASPSERMVLLCRSSQCRIGLVTNGEQWMLVNAPVGETSGYASWYARFWWQEPVTLKAFQSLIGVRRCFGPEEDTLPRLLERSLEFQEEVTNTLGEQVRRAVEVLIQALGRADQDRNGELLKDIAPSELYEAGLTVMMRLVFLLSAEERGLLLLGDPIYDQHYAISTLRAKLREDADQHGVEVLERRHDAWSRLLATFRGIFDGIEHEALRLPALGGSLFDPDRFPFLEGRTPKTKWREQTAVPLPIDNRTVLLLMTALQILEQKGGALLLSYRALDVEQIGHVYEGLLEFTAARVPEITLGLIGTKKIPNPQITLSELESIAAKGDDNLLEDLKELTGRSLAALRKALNTKETRESLLSLVQASNGDENLARRLLPFGELIRADSWGSLLVYRQGSFAIVKGTDRRSSGTHYTPRSLTEPVVRYTLEPLVYVGPAEGTPQREWTLKSSADILALNVCDMACGSGAFLVEACRYLSLRLVEAWANEEASGFQIGIDGIACETLGGHEPLPKQLDDRLLIARRLVAQSCIYGVDINHLAVELAKLAIWLVTLAKNKPFSFLDHALRCGDSLVGLHDLEQLRFFSLRPDAENRVLFKGPLNTAVDEAIDLRLKLEGRPADTVADVEAQSRLLAQAEDDVARLKCSADLLVAAEFWGESNADKLERTRDAAVKSAWYVDNGPTEEFQQIAAKERRGQRMFHWPLEFPEVIVRRGGFDAFVGNPPFRAGRFLSGDLGVPYLCFLQYPPYFHKGQADFCASFCMRAFVLMNAQGVEGFIVTKTISEGDTRAAFLSQVNEQSARLIWVRSLVQWPGAAQVVVSTFVLSKFALRIRPMLDDRECEGIDATFSAVEGVSREPTKLLLSSRLVGKGVGLGGSILRIAASDEQQLDDPTHIRRFITGVNHNSFVDRWGGERVYWFEDCESIDDLRVLETGRHFIKQVGEAKAGRFWRYRRGAGKLYALLNATRFCIARTQTSSTWWFSFWPKNDVLDQTMIAFGSNCAGLYCVLWSSLHESWVSKYGRLMKTDTGYSPSEAFCPFPLPYDPIDGSCESLASLAIQSDQLREQLRMRLNVGITECSLLTHDMTNTDRSVTGLRRIVQDIDVAVAATYGWDDLALDHGFHQTKQGIRFTISESARREVLKRLLKLNHERYAEEVEQGLHRSGGSRAANRSASADQSQPTLDFEAGTGAASTKSPRQRRTRP